MADRAATLIEFLSAGTGVSKGNATLNTNGYVYAFVAGTTLNITNVTTGAGVITVTTSVRHGLAAGAKVFISGIAGGAAGNNTTGNPAWTITPVTNSVAVTDASNQTPIVVTAPGHTFANSDVVTVSGVLGRTAANGTWTVAGVNGNTFQLANSSGANSPAYVSNPDATVGLANKFSLDGSTGSGSYTPSTGTVQVCAPVWQNADKSTAWSNSRVGPLDGTSARPSAPVYADSRLRLAVYDSSLSLLYNVDQAQYGGFGVVVNVREDFGAKGDARINGPFSVGGVPYWTGTDDTAAINAALAWAANFNAATPGVMAKVYFPTGTYLTNGSLLLQRLNNLGQYQPVCVEMYGDHRAFPVGNSDLYSRASYIVQLSNVVPALAVQCARGVVVRNLGFIGQNIFPANFKTDDVIDDATFVNKNCRDEKNSPYGGLVIDYAKDSRPTAMVTSIVSSSGASPAVIQLSAIPSGLTLQKPNVRITGGTGDANFSGLNGYHQVTAINGTQVTLEAGSKITYTSYNANATLYGGTPDASYGYPGMSDNYLDLTPSSAVTVEGCSFEQFVCGICIAPNAQGNAENIYIKDTGFLQHKVAIAVCQNQSRNVVVENCSAGWQMFFVSTRTYGYGGPYYSNAVPPFIHKCSVDNTKYLFNVDLGFQTFHVTGLYAEGVLSLGYIGATPDRVAGPGNFGATLIGCSIGFHTRGLAGGTASCKAIDFHLMSYAPVEFRGSSLSTAGGVSPLVFANFGPLTFADSWLGSYSQPHGSFAFAFQNPGVVKFENARVFDYTIPINQFAILNGDYDTTVTTGPTAFPPRQPLASPDYLFEGSRLRVIGTKLKVITPSLWTGVLTSTGTVGEAQFSTGATTFPTLLPGDVVYVTNILGVGTGFSAEWYTNQGAASTALDVSNAIVGVVEDQGSLPLTGPIKLKFVPQKFWPYVDGSTTVTLEVRYLARYHPRTYGTLSASSATITSVTPDPAGGNWAANDRIDGPAIASGSYVTNASVANQLRISTNATATIPGVPLVDADSVTQVLDGSRDPSVPAVQTNLYPAARKLLWEVKALNSASEAGTRIYATGSALEIAVNARWDGTNWNQDLTSGWSSSKLAIGATTTYFYGKAATGGTPWSDNAWDTVSRVLTPPVQGVAANFYKQYTPGSQSWPTTTTVVAAYTPATGYLSILPAYVIIPIAPGAVYTGVRLTYSDNTALVKENLSTTQSLTIDRNTSTWSALFAKDGKTITKVEFYVRNPSPPETDNIGQFTFDGQQF